MFTVMLNEKYSYKKILVFNSDEYVKVKTHRLCNASLSTLEKSKTLRSFQQGFLYSEAPYGTVLSTDTHVADVRVKFAFLIATVMCGMNASCQFNGIH